MFKWLDNESPEKAKRRGFATQVMVGLLGALFAGALLALMGWNARTNVEIKEEISGMNETLKGVDEDIDENRAELDEHDRRLRNNRGRIQENAQEIDRNRKELEELRPGGG
jgi:chromosome segregation ATPase